MRWFRRTPEQLIDAEARRGEQAAELRARRRLLGLARHLGWPEVMGQSAGGRQWVAPQRLAWKLYTRVQSPAVIVQVMHVLYAEYTRSIEGRARS